MKKIKYIAHEYGVKTGASIVLRTIYLSCKNEKEYITMKIEKGIGSRVRRYFDIIKIITKDDSTVYHINTSTAIDFAILCLFFNRRFILHIHEAYEFGGIFRKIRLFFLKIIQSKIVLVDERYKNIIPKAHYIRPYLDIEGYLPRPNIGSPTNRFAIIGTIDRNKNQEDGINLFQRLRNDMSDYQLFLFGEITDPVYFQLLKDRFENVFIWEGAQARNIIHEKYDVLIACSKSESFGLAVAEAISLGKMVIFTNRTAYPGLNIPNSDNIIEAGKIPRDWRKRLSIPPKINEEYLVYYSYKSYLSNISKVYHEVLGLHDAF